MTSPAGQAASESELLQHIRHYQELVGSDVNFAFQTIMDASDFDVIAFEALADNFGRRKVDLRPLAVLQPEQIKLDRTLTQNIHEQSQQQALMRATMTLAGELGMRVVAAGIETKQEFQWLQELGIERFQGYFFAQPGLDDENLHNPMPLEGAQHLARFIHHFGHL